MGVAAFIRPPLARQPAGGIPQIEWANPITKGLVFCAWPLGANFVDLVTRIPGTPTGSLAPDRRSQGGGFSRAADAVAAVAGTTTSDQVAWPASATLRGGSAIQQGTILCLGGITEQASTKQYFFGSSMAVDGSGMSLRISTGLTGSSGSIMRGKSSTTAIGWSTGQLLGATPGLQTHFFGYSYTGNGAAGNWYGARTAESWSGGSTFGTGNSGRRLLLYTDYDTVAYSEKKTYITLFPVWDRPLSLEEYQALFDNPWQLVRRPRSRLWLPRAAGGGPTGLLVSDGAHAHTADSLTLTTATTLAIADATHAHATDALTLVVGSVLSVAQATHGHIADALALSLQSSLSVADSAHAHASDGPVLSVQSALVVADASHGHAADAPALAVQSVLAVADAAHGHAADNLTLAVAGATTLAVADASHAHTVDGLTLTAASVLAIQEALHAHAADALTLDTGGATALLLADALHAHTSDGLELTVDAWLVVADTTHAHQAANVVLTFGGATIDPALIRRVARSPFLPRLVRGAALLRSTLSN